MTARILVVDDLEPNVKLLEAKLSAEYFDVITAMNGPDAIEAARAEQPDIVLLDVMMPGRSGWDFLEELRRENDTVPVLFLTARHEVEERVKGLRLGADDYIIKPFDPAEVVARIRARLRRDAPTSQTGDTARFGPWTAHFDRYVLEDDSGQETPFSHAEGEVLRLFLDRPKRLISRQAMQEALGGAAGESFDRAMDVRISRLRTKLREDPKNPRLIKTIYGAGYIFLGDVSWS